MKNRIVLLASIVLTLLFCGGSFFFAKQALAPSANLTRIFLSGAAALICCALYLVSLIVFFAKLSELHEEK